MGRRRLPMNQRRVPLAVLVAPVTRERLRVILTQADGTWSLGGIIDAAIASAKEELMEAADDRRPVIVTWTAQTERNLGLAPEP